MADYYPLIARAVETVKDAPAETRAQVYERARAALLKHLKATGGALGPEAVEREEAALDAAIARVEAEILSGDAPGSNSDPLPAPEEPAAPPPPPGPPSGPRRPLAPVASAPDATAAQAGRQRWRLMATGGAVASLALVIAAVAVTRREDPARYGPTATVAAAPVDPAAGPKIGQRVAGDSPDPAPAQPRAPDPAPGPVASAPQAGAPSAAQPQVAVAQRAILYEERPEAPNEPTVVQGRAIWRLDTAQASSGDGQEPVIRIEVDFPERAMGLEMVIRRNSDAALVASHLVEIKFAFRAGGGPVKDIASPPTMKQEENQRGSPLVGLQVPVMENFFLVGLSNAPADVERNIAQLQSANWIDIPFRFANDRIGVVAIEKGTQGADAIQTALARWRN